MKLFAAPVIALIRLWQIGPSRVLPPTCRFTPSCSAYSIAAIDSHGLFHGSWLAVRRILRCNPWGGSGYDPIPPLHSIKD